MDIVLTVRCKKRKIEHVVDFPYFSETKLINDRGKDLDNGEGSFLFQSEFGISDRSFEVPGF